MNNQAQTQEKKMDNGNRICRSCNKPFVISVGEVVWLKEHNLELFTHCQDCRKSRKQARLAATASPKDPNAGKVEF